MSHKLKFIEKISKSKAIDKFFVHAKFGLHSLDYRPKTKSELQEFLLSKGYNTDKLLDSIRNPRNPVPIFENLIGATWTASSGMKVKQQDGDGNIKFELEGPGKIIFSRYQSHFEAACKARDRTVSNISYSDFQNCLSQGFTSIDSFLNECADQWNKKNPNDLLEDNFSKKVSLETKIDEWLPKISNDQTIDKSVKQWNDFKVLKKIRDEEAVHPKNSGGGIELKKLAEYLNAFRFGIALLLGNMHLLLGRPIPSIIINAHYISDVIVVEE
jgi:hypothetical protein